MTDGPELYRLKAMTSNDGQWDLSEKDVAALKWAIDRIERPQAPRETSEAKDAPSAQATPEDAPSGRIGDPVALDELGKIALRLWSRGDAGEFFVRQAEDEIRLLRARVDALESENGALKDQVEEIGEEVDFLEYDIGLSGDDD